MKNLPGFLEKSRKPWSACCGEARKSRTGSNKARGDSEWLINAILNKEDDTLVLEMKDSKRDITDTYEARCSIKTVT